MEIFHTFSSKNEEFAHLPAGNPIPQDILVIHDNDLLCDIIKSNLTHIPLNINGTGPKQVAEKAKLEFGPGDLDLIIIAISNSSKWEPIVFLFHTALINLVGKIPFLIVSDRRFDSDDEGKIFHLNFPLDVGELRNKVQLILNKKDDQTGSVDE